MTLYPRFYYAWLACLLTNFALRQATPTAVRILPPDRLIGGALHNLTTDHLQVNDAATPDSLQGGAGSNGCFVNVVLIDPPRSLATPRKLPAVTIFPNWINAVCSLILKPYKILVCVILDWMSSSVT